MRRVVVIAGAAAAGAGAVTLSRHRVRGPEACSRLTKVSVHGVRAGRAAGLPGQRAGGLADRQAQADSSHAGVYEVVAEMLDLRPEDELLDIGCGPGGFLAAKARHVRRVVGLDPSQFMLREAERRLADRIAAGTAQLLLGSAAALPFGDGEFSAVTAITAPASPGRGVPGAAPWWAPRLRRRHPQPEDARREPAGGDRRATGPRPTPVGCSMMRGSRTWLSATRASGASRTTGSSAATSRPRRDRTHSPSRRWPQRGRQRRWSRPPERSSGTVVKGDQACRPRTGISRTSQRSCGR